MFEADKSEIIERELKKQRIVSIYLSVFNTSNWFLNGVMGRTVPASDRCLTY